MLSCLASVCRRLQRQGYSDHRQRFHNMIVHRQRFHMQVAHGMGRRCCVLCCALSVLLIFDAEVGFGEGMDKRYVAACPVVLVFGADLEQRTDGWYLQTKNIASYDMCTTAFAGATLVLFCEGLLLVTATLGVRGFGP